MCNTDVITKPIGSALSGINKQIIKPILGAGKGIGPDMGPMSDAQRLKQQQDQQAAADAAANAATAAAEADRIKAEAQAQDLANQAIAAKKRRQRAQAGLLSSTDTANILSTGALVPGKSAPVTSVLAGGA